MAASRASAIGTEDERVHREAPEEHRVSRSWMGDALTLLPLGAALQIEDGVHSRRLTQPLPTRLLNKHVAAARVGNLRAAWCCQCVRPLSAVSVSSCVMLYQSRQLI